MNLAEIERLAREIEGGGWNLNEYINALPPSVILRLVEIAKAAQTYYDRYAQDEAEDGAMLAKGWPEDRMYSGCSRRQAEDALALRSALDSAKEQA
jgi:hypothetical protein